MTNNADIKKSQSKQENEKKIKNKQTKILDSNPSEDKAHNLKFSKS